MADPRDPRITELLAEIGAKDQQRHSVARLLLPVDDPMIEQYVNNTSSPLHPYKLKIVAAYQIDNSRDKEFRVLLTNHKLLWHGAEPKNIYPILRDGFKTASINGLFGQGIYFTDCVTKAANFTSSDQQRLLGGADNGSVKPAFSPSGYLFLAQVALGRVNEYKEPNHGAKTMLKGADSAFGKGTYRPSETYSMRGAQPAIGIPMGELKQNEELKLKHNEYVIFSSTQVRHQYLVKVEIVS